MIATPEKGESHFNEAITLAWDSRRKNLYHINKLLWRADEWAVTVYVAVERLRSGAFRVDDGSLDTI